MHFKDNRYLFQAQLILNFHQYRELTLLKALAAGIH